ncbi:fatty-acyl-CoA synthase [Antricoccus suffuscus]|uniref:Fatty-acyl-CoA synthase n=1 Tax=Antricoccus suffuscus TaxID=1629062 RepID=A0A2T1A484_9ACTN|nr:fatty acyl-AMP ligase [Antricoccus suffuscus]PRZ43416.1 fatty-acyl-CoA synthase [Antricoccus suffuscus]
MSDFLATMVESATSSAADGWFCSKSAAGDMTTRPWSEVHEEARRCAHALQSAGVRNGSAVALLIGAPREVAVVAQAVWLCGASVTMLHQPTPRTDLRRYAAETIGVLAMIGAEVVVVGEPFATLADSFGNAAPGGGIRALTVDRLCANTTGLNVDPDTVPESAYAVLQLTSGSTSKPKAVRISHRSLMENMRAMVDRSEFGPDDVMVSWLPVFHDMGMIGFLTVPMTFGFKLVKVTPADFLATPLLWMQLISDYEASVTAAPNFAYSLVARALDKAGPLDLHRLRIAMNGAEPIDPRAVKAFVDAGARHGVDPAAVLPAYGMAEASLAVSFSKPGIGARTDVVDAHALGERRQAVPATEQTERTATFVMLGEPLDGIEVSVRDDEGHSLGEREVGVLHIRGTAITDSYLTTGGPQSTKDADGWLDTGDEGYLVARQIVVCGRRKDLIILAGRNIYPTDVERIAEDADGVRAGNTVAVRWGDNQLREAFAIGVESREAGDLEAERRIVHDVTTMVVERLSARPAVVVVLPIGALPKTPSGKIQRLIAHSVIRAALEKRRGAGGDRGAS